MLAHTFKYVKHQSAPYRERFGAIRGLLIWFRTRRNYKLPKGAIYAIQAPGIEHPIYLRAGTSDLLVFQQIVCQGETSYRLKAAEQQLIVDAGANIGLASVMLAIAYPKSKIIALEVEDNNYKMLCMNARNYPNIHPQKKALWGTDGYVKIQNPTAEAWAFRVVQTKADDPGAVEAISLDRILHDNNADHFSLVKIDIEGAEVDLLECARPKWIDRTEAIAIELHDRIRPGCTDSFERLLVGRRYVETQHGEYRLVQFLP